MTISSCVKLRSAADSCKRPKSRGCEPLQEKTSQMEAKALRRVRSLRAPTETSQEICRTNTQDVFWEVDIIHRCATGSTESKSMEPGYLLGLCNKGRFERQVVRDACCMTVQKCTCFVRVNEFLVW